MLLQFRNITRGWVATAIVGLIGLATVLFLIPNSGLNLSGGAALATVAGEDITAPQVSRDLDIELRNQRSQGANVTRQDAIDAGLHLRVLERLIARLAMDRFAQKQGVSASDTMVASYIRELPPTRNPVTGAFDEAAYDSMLNQLRFTRPEFEEEIRGDLTRQMIFEPLITGIRAPASFGALMLSYQAETRVVSVAQAPASAVGAIPQPNEAQLQMFWEESQERLRVPEFRALTLVYARPEDFIARVDVPEARLQEEFEARRVALSQPERRSYVRIAAQNEAQANAAAQRLSRGEDAQAVAQALNLQLTRGDNQTRGEISDGRVAEAVFSMQPRTARAVRGEISPWVAVRVENVTAAVEPNFAAIREELRSAIARDEAAELMNDAVSAYEDARAGGASAADAARTARLAIVSIPAVEEQGRDANGAEIEALAGQTELLRTAFQTPEGEASDFIPVGDADVVVAVDRVTASHVRPLEEVREALTQAWISRERVRRLREMGEEMLAAVRGGQTFAAAARAHRFNVVVSSQQIDRRMAGQIPSRGLAGQIFAAPEGGLASDVQVDGGAMLVAQVERINRVDPSTMPQQVEAARLEIQQSLASSYGNALQDEIVRRANVRRNDELINSTFRQTGADAEGEGSAEGQ